MASWTWNVSKQLYFGLSPFPVIVSTRIITFLVGDPYKPSFAILPLLLGRGTTQALLKYPLKYKKKHNGSCHQELCCIYTHLKTNMESENTPLKKQNIYKPQLLGPHFSFGGVPCIV